MCIRDRLINSKKRSQNSTKGSAFIPRDIFWIHRILRGEGPHQRAFFLSFCALCGRFRWPVKKRSPYDIMGGFDIVCDTQYYSYFFGNLIFRLFFPLRVLKKSIRKHPPLLSLRPSNLITGNKQERKTERQNERKSSFIGKREREREKETRDSFMHPLNRGLYACVFQK